MQETPVPFVGREDSLEKGKATHSSILGLPLWVSWLKRSPGEGKGYPLQYSGLENSMGSMVHGVAESDPTEHLPRSLSYLLIDLS